MIPNLSLCLLLTVPVHDGNPAAPEVFHHDPTDVTVAAEWLEGSELYDPCVLDLGEERWGAWLESVPGEGDLLWVGRFEGEEWKILTQVHETPASYARPTLTADGEDRVWLSFETRNPEGFWELRTTEVSGEFPWTYHRLSSGEGNAINHRVAGAPALEPWFVWQEDRGGQWEVVACNPEAPHEKLRVEQVSTSVRSDWCPSVAANAAGEVVVAWDRRAESYDVLLRRRNGDGEWGPIREVAAGPGFQARAAVAASPNGRIWISWEEGAPGWGEEFRSIEREWNNVTDEVGPMHRFRRLRVGELIGEAGLRMTEPLPMPSFAVAAEDEERREGLASLGVFYERPVLCVDDRERVWIAYRHYAALQLARQEPVKHHVETGWRIHARCWTAGGWSSSFGFDVGQRDGMQRLSLSPMGSGFVAAWDSGRTDRRRDPLPRGVAFAAVELEPGEAPSVSGEVGALAVAPGEQGEYRLERATDGDFQLFFGDLHRHTDLSLCFPFFDGSIEDAYRYSTDVARLDFVGITDHARDLDRGRVQSQLWWRSVKETTRHRLKGTFFPYFAYERSHQDTDHNVISLRDDVLRNFPPPLTEFWAGIDQDTFTIPHVPYTKSVWDHHHDGKRPLAEIYQGARNQESSAALHEGLGRGYHFGFIASSDHLSTNASFACVWAPAANRKAVFRAMQARRVYGATARMELIFRCGSSWMGERVVQGGEPLFTFSVKGTAPLERIDFHRDGEIMRWITPTPGRSEATGTISGEALEGEHYYYVHVTQVDGNQAWSSPIWIRPRP